MRRLLEVRVRRLIERLAFAVRRLGGRLDDTNRRFGELLDFAIWRAQVRVMRTWAVCSDQLRTRSDAAGTRLRAWYHVVQVRWTNSKWPDRVQAAINRLRTGLLKCYDWMTSRDFRHLLAGSPALVVAGAVALVLFLQAARSPLKHVHRYRSAARRALVAEDWSSADLWLQKLTQLGASDSDTLLRRAYVLNRLGRRRQAVRLLRKLAPSRGAGHPEAHYLLATWAPWKRGEEGIRIHHLQAATGSQFGSRAHVLLAAAYKERQQYTHALEHLAAAVESDAELRFEMAHLHHLQGDTRAARRQLRAAERHYRQLVQADRRDVEARIRWATACSLQRRYTAAEEIVRAGFAEGPDARLSAALANIYSTMAAELEAAGPETLNMRLGLLQQALSSSADDELALRQLAQLLKSTVADPAVFILHRALADGHGTPLIHLILAVYNQRRGDLGPAAFHMQQAYRFSPGMPQVANNLALTLAQRDPAQLRPALDLVDLALRVQPESTRIRSTRGQILAKQGRWAEALPDLEQALDAMPEDRELHETLSQAYQQLGDSRRAEQHRDLARQANATPAQP